MLLDSFKTKENTTQALKRAILLLRYISKEHLVIICFDKTISSTFLSIFVIKILQIFGSKTQQFLLYCRKVTLISFSLFHSFFLSFCFILIIAESILLSNVQQICKVDLSNSQTFNKYVKLVYPIFTQHLTQCSWMVNVLDVALKKE